MERLKSRPLNTGSKFLTPNENQKFFDALGPNRVSLVAGHVFTIEIDNRSICPTSDGILSFVKDYEKKLHALILFDINSSEEIWTEVLKSDYIVIFHPHWKKILIFKNNNKTYQICFFNEMEAQDIKLHLDKKSEVDRKKMLEKIENNKAARIKSTSLLNDNSTTSTGIKPPIPLRTTSMNVNSASDIISSKINLFKLMEEQHHTGSSLDDRSAPNLNNLSLNDTHEFVQSSSNKPVANVKPFKINSYDDSDFSSSDSDSDTILNEEELAKLGIKQFDKNNLEYVRKLGNGNFGIVSKYEVKDQTLIPHKFVAVKEIDKERSADIREVKNFGRLKHENIVDFIGYYEDHRCIYIVMEFLPNNNLYEFLLNYENKFTIAQAFDMLLQIAKGMKYLHSLNIIHRDLAARNCMLSMNKKMVKINDFGLSRNLYGKDYYRQGINRCFPIAWTALECLKGGPFTQKSDVWSFGVLMWEMFARQEPYPEIRTEHELISILSKNQRLKRPIDSCSPNTYDLMKFCWLRSAKKRPSFNVLYSRIQLIMDDMANDGEVDMSEERSSSSSSLFTYKSSMDVKAFRNKNTNTSGFYV